MTPRARIAIVAVAVVALVVAFIVAVGGGGSDDNKQSGGAATTVPVVTVAGAKPQGGIQRLTFAKGGEIRFTVHSDTADEIHVHGYDVHKDVAKGGSVTFSIPATIEGRFVVELEDHKTQIAELEVTP